MASGSSPTTPTPDSLPYVMRLSDSLCFQQYTASLKCLETNYGDKSKCQQQFDDYKACKMKERELRLERNRSRSLFQ